jgi:hypothetical protein
MKNMELGPNSRFFPGVFGSEVSGAIRVWQGVRGGELRMLEWSSSKHALRTGKANESSWPIQ